MAIPGDREITVNVTQEDILLGRKRNSELCPIARAIWREVSQLEYGQDHVAVSDETYVASWLYDLDDKGKRFMRCFDRGYAVEPCTVTLLKATQPLYGDYDVY